MNAAQALRDALIERWFDTENTDPATVTDEQILARLEDLVGEGWHHAGRESERADRLRGRALASRLAELEHQLKATTAALNEHLGRSRDRPFAPPLDPNNRG